MDKLQAGSRSLTAIHPTRQPSTPMCWVMDGVAVDSDVDVDVDEGAWVGVGV